ncbi:alpha/beta hydrolase [Streptosporangium sp. NPDC051023]|uniref:alpha/beta fold hydrolase n=1 Tax=Streptosporangium sp. NPDC051023 TaxID=3155410 RepID=UPI00344F0841
MPAVSVSGIPVTYDVAGAGPQLVLVHGTGGDARTNFGRLVGRFADRRTVITPNYSGSGGTPLPAGELTVDLLADQVAATFDGPADLVGFSLGAVVAAAVAAKHPGRVRSLVLIAGWANGADDPRLRLGLSLWAKSLGDRNFAGLGVLLAFSPAFVRELADDGLALLLASEPPPGTARQIALDLEVDIRDRLPLITAPTLVVGNTQDHLIPVEHARELHRLIPGSRYAELDSGHIVVHERPAELTELIREFILPEIPGGRARAR